jgi:molybdenum cofactor biosynthesis enzyme MoaA
MPEEGVPLTKKENLLKTDEIIKLVALFARLGVNKIRFTGGEPLVRSDCIDIIRETKKINGIQTIAMTTNGILLPRKALELKEAGLTHLNISLDTLQEKKFEFISKRRGWNKVMDGIKMASELNFKPLKVKKIFFELFLFNSVVLRSTVC